MTFLEPVDFAVLCPAWYEEDCISFNLIRLVTHFSSLLMNSSLSLKRSHETILCPGIGLIHKAIPGLKRGLKNAAFDECISNKSKIGLCFAT